MAGKKKKKPAKTILSNARREKLAAETGWTLDQIIRWERDFPAVVRLAADWHGLYKLAQENCTARDARLMLQEHNGQTLLAALRDAVAFMDRHDHQWTHAEIKRLAEIKLLSLGV